MRRRCFRATDQQSSHVLTGVVHGLHTSFSSCSVGTVVLSASCCDGIGGNAYRIGRAYSVKPYSNRGRSAPPSTAGAIEKLDDLPLAPDAESRYPRRAVQRESVKNNVHSVWPMVSEPV
jgi:hypothetical protein